MGKRGTFCAIVALAAFAALPVAASDTTEVSANPIFANGQLRGCELVFLAVQDDRTYYSGLPAGISGSLSINRTAGRVPWALIKIGIFDPNALAFVSPEHTYLISGYTTNAGDQSARFESEDEGFALFSFGFGERTMDALESITLNGELVVGVQPPGGTTAIRFPLPVEGEALMEWLQCSSSLFELMLADLSE